MSEVNVEVDVAIMLRSTDYLETKSVVLEVIIKHT